MKQLMEMRESRNLRRVTTSTVADLELWARIIGITAHEDHKKLKTTLFASGGEPPVGLLQELNGAKTEYVCFRYVTTWGPILLAIGYKKAGSNDGIVACELSDLRTRNAGLSGAKSLAPRILTDSHGYSESPVLRLSGNDVFAARLNSMFTAGEETK